MKKSKFWTFVFSLIPGVGHMYLGLVRQGIQLSALFFFLVFFIDQFDIALFAFVIPILWFYSLFDVWNKAKSEEPLEDTDLAIFIFLQQKQDVIEKPNQYRRWMSYGLFFVAAYIFIFNGLFEFFIRMPMVGWIFDVVRVVVKSLIGTAILIYFGVKMLPHSEEERVEI